MFQRANSILRLCSLPSAVGYVCKHRTLLALRQYCKILNHVMGKTIRVVDDEMAILQMREYDLGNRRNDIFTTEDSKCALHAFALTSWSQSLDYDDAGTGELVRL